MNPDEMLSMLEGILLLALVASGTTLAMAFVEYRRTWRRRL